MPDVVWTRLGRPGDVAWARAGDAAIVAVGTAGGHLYLRRRTEAGWRWERLGVPPGVENVLDTTLIPVDGADGVVPVVVGGDATVWLHRPGGGPTPWTPLSGPAPDVEFFTSSGDIAASAIRRGGMLRHTLVINSPAGRPWIRQGIDPEDIWFRIAADTDWISSELAAAVASVAPGSAPQPHIFTVAKDRESFEQIFRVGVSENSLWTWIDPGVPDAFAEFMETLSATAFRDGSGLLQACAIATLSEEGNLSMLIGAGRDWQWFDLGQPTAPDNRGLFVTSAVVAAKDPEPKPGEPVVIARTGDGNIWTRTLTGDWKDLGAAPLALYPTSAVEVAAADGRERVFTAGVSQDSDLWTLESDATGRQWEDHGCPGSVVSIVGAYDVHPESHVRKRAIGIPVLDGDGALWTCQIRGNPTSGLTNRSKSWAYHGQPAPGVNCASGVGVLTVPGGAPPGFRAWIFVIGSDGRLWARTSGSEGWTWVDHGAPTGRSVRTGVPPISVRLPPFVAPVVHVLADDGRLWMRTSSDSLWTDRGAPPGQLNFAIVGAEAFATSEGRLAIAAAVTGDGHLWINVPDGATFRWTDLGIPTPAEKIVAGIGIERVTVPDGIPMLDIVVVGSPSGQVWSHRWSPDGTTRWTSHGRPADARIRAAIGVMRDSTNAAGCLMSVIGNDQQVWLASSAGGGWTRWDPRSPATTVTSGRAAVLLNVLPCTVILDNERRVHVVTPTRQ